jgi:hypothetical protein
MLCLNSLESLVHFLALILSDSPQLLGPGQLILVSRFLLSKAIIVINELIQDPFEFIPSGSPLCYLFAHCPYLGLPLGYPFLFLLHLPTQAVIIARVSVDYGLLVLGLPLQVIKHLLVPL